MLLFLENLGVCFAYSLPSEGNQAPISLRAQPTSCMKPS